MSTPTRIYVVTNTKTGEKTPVEATHPANAVRTITDDLYQVSIPTTSELATLIEGGAKVIRPAAPASPEAA